MERSSLPQMPAPSGFLWVFLKQRQTKTSLKKLNIQVKRTRMSEGQSLQGHGSRQLHMKGVGFSTQLRKAPELTQKPLKTP